MVRIKMAPKIHQQLVATVHHMLRCLSKFFFNQKTPGVSLHYEPPLMR